MTEYNATKYEPSQYEDVVIGALLLRPKGFFEIPWIEPQYFRKDVNKYSFESIKKTILSGGTPDSLSVYDYVSERLSSVTKSDIGKLTENIPSATSIVSYANKLRRDYTAFKLLESVENINTIVEDTSIDNPEDMLSRVLGDFLEMSNEIKSEEGNDIVSIIEKFTDRKKQFALAKNDGKELLGWSTGFQKFDENSEGLQPGHLSVLGGYTSTGKTFLTLNILVSLLKQKARCKFISLEMSQVDILGRIISIVTGIDSRRYIKGEEMSEDEIKKVQGALIGLKNTQLTITEDRNWERIKLSIIKQAISGGIDVIFIDYLQMITLGGKSEYELTSIISQDLQQIAKQYNIHIVMLSQVSNDHAKNASTSDHIGFKGGGTIAASADIAIELVNVDSVEVRQDRAMQGLPYNVDMIMKKNRHGKIGKIPLSFNTFNGQFTQQKTNDMSDFTSEMKEKLDGVDNYGLPFDK